ncbi:hypothetical protein [Rodentibacter caecimuris]|uniref:hypothetical protein n=1 Tax=Rodentibacter caecimuris TaxID=1796644 RepID=UPI00258757EB|nr:hypothetical protein [Rodentibacter heylii]
MDNTLINKCFFFGVPKFLKFLVNLHAGKKIFLMKKYLFADDGSFLSNPLSDKQGNKRD